MLKVNHLSGFGKKRPAAGGGGFDTDAQAFFTATGITDTTIKDAVDALVVGLKADSLWAKLEAIYPLVGGTSSTHAVNLKSPGTFDISWTGTITHNANGVTGGGSSDHHGDTGYNEATHGATDDIHISLYSRTNSFGNMFGMGCANATGHGTYMQEQDGSFNFRTKCQNTSNTDTAAANSLGYFSVNRTASAGYRKRQNGTNTDVTADSNQDAVSVVFYVLARNANGTAGGRSTRNYAWFALGQGLTETEDGNLRTRVETFQDALSRGVV